MTNIIRLDLERIARAPLPECSDDERAKVAAIFGHISKELSWRAYEMLKNGELVKPAPHDEAMAMSETVYTILAAGFHEVLVDHYG